MNLWCYLRNVQLHLIPKSKAEQNDKIKDKIVQKLRNDWRLFFFTFFTNCVLTQWEGQIKDKMSPAWIGFHIIQVSGRFIKIDVVISIFSRFRLRSALHTSYTNIRFFMYGEKFFYLWNKVYVTKVILLLSCYFAKQFSLKSRLLLSSKQKYK